MGSGKNDIQYVIYGAGAVGSVIGGCLAGAGKRVLLIARPDHCAAIAGRGGLELRNYERTWIQPIQAVTHLEAAHLEGESVVFLAVKTPDTRACIRQLTAMDGGQTAVFCFQNTVENERIAGSLRDRVYGAVIKMTCSLIDPGIATYRRAGELIVGRFPKGTDSWSASVAADLNAAGFRASEARDIEQEKILKLLLNLNSTTHAIIRQEEGREAAYADIRYRVLREGCDVLAAAGMPLISEHQNLPKLLEELRLPAARLGKEPFPVRNSTWQNLYLGKDKFESGFYHNFVIRLGEENGVTTPCNHTLISLIDELIAGKDYRPEAFSTDDFQRRLKQLFPS